MVGKKGLQMKKFEFENSESWLSSLGKHTDRIPDWYRAMPTTNSNSNRLPSLSTIKSCSPFLDSFLTGYILTTPVDIAVRVEGGIPLVSWSDSKYSLVGVRDSHLVAPNFPVPEGHHDTHLVWLTQLAIRVPKGYSITLTHPLNRYELPFTTLSGVIDADTVLPNGSIPFFMKKNFEGVIPQGTPFAQILPFKREKWKAEETPGLYANGRHYGEKARLTYNYYKNNLWHKKEYK